MNAWEQYHPPVSDMAHQARARRPRVLVLSNPDPDQNDEEPRSPPSPVSGPQYQHLQHHLPRPPAPPGASRPYHAATSPARTRSPHTSNTSTTPPYATSESSRSSPVVDTSPPPSTPSLSTAPNFEEANSLEGSTTLGLGLRSVVSEEPSKLDYGHSPRPTLAAPHNRRPSEGQRSQASPVVTSASSSVMSPDSGRPGSIDKIVIQVTRDQEQFAVVDISNAREAHVIREYIYTALRFPDDEHHCLSIYHTEIGEGTLGPPLDDNALLIICNHHGDARGSLKFMVLPTGATAPGSVNTTPSSRYPLPPPPRGAPPAPTPAMLQSLPPVVAQRRAQKREEHSPTDSASTGDRIDGSTGYVSDNDFDANKPQVRARERTRRGRLQAGRPSRTKTRTSSSSDVRPLTPPHHGSSPRSSYSHDDVTPQNTYGRQPLSRRGSSASAPAPPESQNTLRPSGLASPPQPSRSPPQPPYASPTLLINQRRNNRGMNDAAAQRESHLEAAEKEREALDYQIRQQINMQPPSVPQPPPPPKNGPGENWEHVKQEYPPWRAPPAPIRPQPSMASMMQPMTPEQRAYHQHISQQFPQQTYRPVLPPQAANTSLPPRSMNLPPPQRPPVSQLPPLPPSYPSNRPVQYHQSSPIGSDSRVQPSQPQLQRQYLNQYFSPQSASTTLSPNQQQPLRRALSPAKSFDDLRQLGPAPIRPPPAPPIQRGVPAYHSRPTVPPSQGTSGAGRNPTSYLQPSVPTQGPLSSPQSAGFPTTPPYNNQNYQPQQQPQQRARPLDIRSGNANNIANSPSHSRSPPSYPGSHFPGAAPASNLSLGRPATDAYTRPPEGRPTEVYSQLHRPMLSPGGARAARPSSVEHVDTRTTSDPGFGSLPPMSHMPAHESHQLHQQSLPLPQQQQPQQPSPPPPPPPPVQQQPQQQQSQVPLASSPPPPPSLRPSYERTDQGWNDSSYGAPRSPCGSPSHLSSLPDLQQQQQQQQQHQAHAMAATAMARDAAYRVASEPSSPRRHSGQLARPTIGLPAPSTPTESHTPSPVPSINVPQKSPETEQPPPSALLTDDERTFNPKTDGWVLRALDDAILSGESTLMPDHSIAVYPQSALSSPHPKSATEPYTAPTLPSVLIEEDEDEEEDAEAEDSDGSDGLWYVPPSESKEEETKTLKPRASTKRPSLTVRTNSANNTPSNSGFIRPVKKNSAPKEHRLSFDPQRAWSFRPPAEDVYEHLEDFFPDHDLDRPMIDATPSGSSSPTSAEYVHVPPPLSNAVSPLTRSRHKKSIRLVAAERKKMLDRVNNRVEASASTIARRRSTKLWGSRVEEVVPPHEKPSIPSSIPESPTGNKPIFKWVRGELIGKGTYGRVYLALNATTGEMIAVKQVEIPKTASDQDDGRQVQVVEALRSESDTLKDLDHPNIVQYLGYEQTVDFLSIFLEYVPGGSVGSCLRKHGKFDESVTKSFTSQILDGLAYLHSVNILHRDLKADNILVDPSGVCKISDFGISKRSVDSYNNGSFTMMQGSVFWMAPEVLNNNKQGYNAKIDIWSLGCVVLEMWAGRRPWQEADMIAVMFNVGMKKLAPPIPDDVQLSPLADDFRQNCFAIDPNVRPTAAQLRKHQYLRLDPGWRFTGFAPPVPPLPTN